MHGKLIFTKYWTPYTDMSRYTDPNHVDENGNPNFWQPPYLKRDYEGDRPDWVTEEMLTD